MLILSFETLPDTLHESWSLATRRSWVRSPRWPYIFLHFSLKTTTCPRVTILGVGLGTECTKMLIQSVVSVHYPIRTKHSLRPRPWQVRTPNHSSDTDLENGHRPTRARRVYCDTLALLANAPCIVVCLYIVSSDVDGFVSCNVKYTDTQQRVPAKVMDGSSVPLCRVGV